MISLKLRLLNEDVEKDEILNIHNKHEHVIGENSVLEQLDGDIHKNSRISEDPIISQDQLNML
jgi:hypothetical protein